MFRGPNMECDARGHSGVRTDGKARGSCITVPEEGGGAKKNRQIM